MENHEKQTDLRRYGLACLLLALLYPLYGGAVYTIWAIILSLLFSLPGAAAVSDGLVLGLACLPHFIPPILCIIGIIRGIRRIHEGKHARICIILSSLGLLAFIALAAVLFLISARRTKFPLAIFP